MGSQATGPTVCPSCFSCQSRHSFHNLDLSPRGSRWGLEEIKDQSRLRMPSHLTFTQYPIERRNTLPVFPSRWETTGHYSSSQGTSSPTSQPRLATRRTASPPGLGTWKTSVHPSWGQEGQQNASTFTICSGSHPWKHNFVLWSCECHFYSCLHCDCTLKYKRGWNLFMEWSMTSIIHG